MPWRFWPGICDCAAAFFVAKEIVATHKARTRLFYLPLNFMDEALPGQHDVVCIPTCFIFIQLKKTRRCLFECVPQ
jgi:hypothetical protein